MTADNRRSTRHFVAIAAKLHVDGNTVEGTLLNISLGGALMTSTTKYAMGQRVQLSFKVPTQEDVIEVGGTIRWANGEQLGLQFDGLRARDVWALNEFFKRLP
ncbi:MAG TPA: PilZ domain-containing protein [Kofleriaceae bacterium]|nr:PilZ domain-containing protein [Kofleriaceae bacterium]